MFRYVWVILCFWIAGCVPVNGLKSCAIPMETVEAEAVLTLAQGHTGEVLGVEVLKNGNILSYSDYSDRALRIWKRIAISNALFLNLVPPRLCCSS